MLLKNGKVYSDRLIRNGIILVNDGTIQSIKYDPIREDYTKFIEHNKDKKELDCQNRLILPGIIDVHAHLRDMEQSDKETFATGTKAAAFSGITTIFTMPNTKPPAISSKIVKEWINRAKNNIFVDVGFIAGVPKEFDREEIERIINLGVFGFKIYPLSPLSGLDWTNPINIQTLLSYSSKFQIPIFVHSDWPLPDKEREKIFYKYAQKGFDSLKIHDKQYSVETEAKYVKFILENYNKIIFDKKLIPEKYPIVHFCHVSCIESYSIIKEAVDLKRDLKITFEITPHHLLLSNNIILKNDNFGKVLPPLRDEKHREFLFDELKKNQIDLIGTDHAPHTKEEKSRDFYSAPSGFPGFETYPLLLLDKVFRRELPLEIFVKVASENPAKIFKLKNKGFIKVGNDADLIIVENSPEYSIKSQQFKTKANFSPYEGFKTSIRIWKVFLRGNEINNDVSRPNGNILKRML